ncbi:hypothetical protein [Hyphomonas sp.]|uniref:hypothetical protein n=1 Tax=Hyphomonas sp. TaxID=87 RepID=UPI000C974479|nr:hypothetical protein [Hyphomonas sp.]MAL46726.1 hypothetical protein [Hyphomonas sp.]
MTNKTPGQIILDAVANGQYNAASEIMSAELFSNVNECMCQRKEKVAYDFGQAISEGDSAYDAFFKKAMKKFGISSPADLKGEEEKKKFFNYIDKNFKASNEENEELEEELFPIFSPRLNPSKITDNPLRTPIDLENEDERRPVKRRPKFPMRNPYMPVSTPADAPPDSPSYREMEMDMGMMDRDDEEEYEYEMDMMSVMPDDEEDGMPDQAFPPRRIKDQGGPGAMQGQMPMGAAPGKMMGGMKPPMQGMGQGMGGMQAPMQGMGQGMQMNPQMIAKMMKMAKKRKGAM